MEIGWVRTHREDGGWGGILEDKREAARPPWRDKPPQHLFENVISNDKTNYQTSLV